MTSPTTWSRARSSTRPACSRGRGRSIPGGRRRQGDAPCPATANGVSERYSFWLGDAFASGGSNGYDHKALGIPRAASGSREAPLPRAEAGSGHRAVQRDRIGDMSGDVFGNGMLSRGNPAARGVRPSARVPRSRPDPDVVRRAEATLRDAGLVVGRPDRLVLSEGGDVIESRGREVGHAVPRRSAPRRAPGRRPSGSSRPADVIRWLLQAPPTSCGTAGSART